MKLELKICYEDKDMGPYVLREDGPCDQFPEVPYYRCPKKKLPILVEAKLTGDFDRNCEYRLQVGKEPDVVAKAKMGNGSDNVAIFYETRNAEARFDLFRYVMANSFLKLIELTYDENRKPIILREVFSEPVYVIPPDNKIKRYKQMMEDMSHDVPQFFLNYITWQMKLCGFRTIWEEGYTSHCDAKMELDAVSDVLHKLRKPFNCIKKAPKTSFGIVYRKLPEERIRRCRGRMARKLERVSGGSIGTDRIMVSVKIVNHDVAAHAVMKEFFALLMRRCDEIRSYFISQVNQLKQDIKVYLDLYKKNRENKAYQGVAFEIEMKLKTYEKYIRETDSVKARAERYHRADLFKDVSKTLRIFDVNRTVFSGNVGYELAYDIILEFERRRHYWSWARHSNKYKTPNLLVDVDKTSDTESKLVRKYSMVYEFWCYYRLIKASEKIAAFVAGQELSSADGSRCIFRKGDIELVIVHGFSAKMNAKDSASSEFWLTKGRLADKKTKQVTEEHAKERTPDFALIFTNVNSGNTKWIVADAKSHERMNYEQIIDKREKYLKFLRRNVPSQRKGQPNPSQAWMFYAGEDENSPCGVECPPLEFTDSSGYEDTQAGSTDYTFSPEFGIVRAEEGDKPRGHVHTNIESQGEDNRPFEDFIKGEFATMERELS